MEEDIDFNFIASVEAEIELALNALVNDIICNQI
jgi:hypothetical protein